MLKVGQSKLFIKQQFESRLKCYCELRGVIKDWLFAFMRQHIPWVPGVKSHIYPTESCNSPSPMALSRGMPELRAGTLGVMAPFFYQENFMGI